MGFGIGLGLGLGIVIVIGFGFAVGAGFALEKGGSKAPAKAVRAKREGECQESSANRGCVGQKKACLLA